MTHDVLLAKIDDEGEFLVQHFDSKPVFIQALRAVLELHAPSHEIFDDNEGGIIDGYWCESCDDSEYPCATIKAIEAVLND